MPANNDIIMISTLSNNKSITQPNSPRRQQIVKKSEKSKSNGSSFANANSGSYSGGGNTISG